MKKVLITGANSYIGTSFEKWVSKYPDKYLIDTIDMKKNDWKEKSFRGYDIIFHVAAIVHIKEKSDELYCKINRDLALDVAIKAKNESVKQFIFLSTMGVYGMETGFIDENTEPNPKTPYAKSKLEAEKLINELAVDSFKVAILRPPIVYGKDCKGNYPRLANMALKLPIFPNVKNERSMIFIDNLSEFVRLTIDNEMEGFFFPQNKEYVNTSELIKLIAKVHGKNVIMTKLFNPLLKFLKVSTLNKVFGDLVYDMSMSDYESDYRVYEFKDSIKMTEE